MGYFTQMLTHLPMNQTILEAVRETSSQSEALIRTVLARLSFPRDDVYKTSALLSGGEKVKAALAKVFLSDNNLLLLDEPTNFLDIAAQETLQEVLQEYPGTLLFASHDRTFINGLASHTLVIEDGRIMLYEGNYDSYLIQAEKQRRRFDGDASETLFKKMQLETEQAAILGKLSMARHQADKADLEQRYAEVIRELNRLR